MGLAGLALGIGGKILFDFITQSDSNNNKKNDLISESEKNTRGN